MNNDKIIIKREASNIRASVIPSSYSLHHSLPSPSFPSLLLHALSYILNSSPSFTSYLPLFLPCSPLPSFPYLDMHALLSAPFQLYPNPPFSVPCSSLPFNLSYPTLTFSVPCSSLPFSSFQSV
jgi:hypothetical protein